MNRDISVQLITDQIAAAKAIQRECFARWRESSPLRGTMILDLQLDLRPRIDRLTDELIDAAVWQESQNDPYPR